MKRDLDVEVQRALNERIALLAPVEIWFQGGRLSEVSHPEVELPSWHLEKSPVVSLVV
jgi:hypothetical protein